MISWWPVSEYPRPMPATGRRTTLVSARYMRTKSKLTVVSAVERDAAVAHEGHGFEKHFRQHHGGSAVEVDAALEPGDERREVPEVAQARRADGFAGRGSMHVDDVGADRDVHGHGNLQARAGAENAQPRE